MKKGTVIAIIVAVVQIFVGLGLLLYYFSTYDFSFDKLFDSMNEVREVVVEDDFEALEVSSSSWDIKIFPSDSGKTRVEYAYVEHIDVSVVVLDGVLNVSVEDNREWYDHMGVFWHNDPRVTVYIPEKDYKNLFVNGSSADVFVAKNLSFENVNIETTSGDVVFNAKVSENVVLKCASGDINASGFESKNINIETVSGEIELLDITASESISAKAVSGDIEFSSIDAPLMQFKTTSGDVEGSVLSKKIFETKTTSGEIRVPKSEQSDGRCEVETISGDIEIRVK